MAFGLSSCEGISTLCEGGNLAPAFEKCETREDGSIVVGKG